MITKPRAQRAESITQAEIDVHHWLARLAAKSCRPGLCARTCEKRRPSSANHPPAPTRWRSTFGTPDDCR